MTTPSDKTLRLERTKINPQPPRRNTTTLVIALVCGVVAAGLALKILTKTQMAPAVTTAAPPTASAVVAAQLIPPRTIITPSMLKTKDVLVSEIPSNAVKLETDAIGKMASNPIQPEQQLTTDVVVVPDPGSGGISTAIKPGNRLLTISVDHNSSIAGFLKPNDHVDILGTFDAGHNQSLTRTILQDVSVVAAGADTLPTHADTGGGTMMASAQPAVASDGAVAKPAEFQDVTLQVSPTDSEKIILAAAKGKLMLTLRAASDRMIADVPVVRSPAVTLIQPDPIAAPQKVAIVQTAPPAPPAGLSTMILPAPQKSITVVRGAETRSISVTN